MPHVPHECAGVLGQVGSSGVLDHVDCSVGFRLQAPPAGARILSAGLRCALLNEVAAKKQPRTRSAFLADLGKLTTADDKVIPSLLAWTCQAVGQSTRVCTTDVQCLPLVANVIQYRLF